MYTSMYSTQTNNINVNIDKGLKPTAALSNAEVHIFRICIDDHLEKLNSYTNLLNAQESLRALRFFKAEDRERFIICRGALKQLLGRYLNSAPETIVIVADDRKKPFIKNDQCLHFNVSHSKKCIVFAISNSNVGIDVEYISEKFNFHPVAQTCFTPAELNSLKESCNATYQFYKIWTRKEAFLKAIGKGINDDMNKSDCLNDCSVNEIAGSGNDTYTINSFEIDKNYIAGIAYSGREKKLRFYDF